jgi:hypothetical protein
MSPESPSVNVPPGDGSLDVRPVGISLVLPISGERATALSDATGAYAEALDGLDQRWEIVLVPNARDEVGAGCERIASARSGVSVVMSAHGWGAAVRAGLKASEGQVLCYANYERTSAAALSEMLRFALRNPDVVLRANRRTRDTRIQRAGSLLFNLECRALLGVSTWDVNGTPKVFPRTFGRLLKLTRDDDLLDVEFSLVCEHEGYPVIEIPIDAELLPGLRSHPDYRAALRMYLGVPTLRAIPPPGEISHAYDP